MQNALSLNKVLFGRFRHVLVRFYPATEWPYKFSIEPKTRFSATLTDAYGKRFKGIKICNILGIYKIISLIVGIPYLITARYRMLQFENFMEYRCGYNTAMRTFI